MRPLALPCLAAALACTACTRGWTTAQIREHLANDFQPGMTPGEVETIVVAYPHGGVASGRWRSREEWYRTLGGPYRPWTAPATDARPENGWSGPRAVVANMLYTGKPFFMLSTWDPPGPNEIWFEFTKTERLRCWGHTYGEDVAIFPPRTAPGAADE